MNKKVRKAIIPAAGLGTRFLPATKAIAKEMLPIVDIPTIQYIIQEAVDSGIEEILIITNIRNGFLFNCSIRGTIMIPIKQKILQL